MKTDLSHLPEGKRQELAFVVELIHKGFDEALSRRTMPRFRNGKILKIVLFGSYARGDWVEDPVGRYFSDYDILVVVNHEDLTDPGEFWGQTEQWLLEALSAGARLRTPVSLIVHSLDDVNAQLRLGRYFFMDIVGEGILLEEEPDSPFVTPKALSSEAALAETRGYYEEWFESAKGFLQHAHYGATDGQLKIAVFQLHQATERFYHCLLLTRSLYSPKTHSLNRLRTLCEELEPSMVGVWPGSNKFERRCYELLRAAYVKARYSPQYRINAEELNWLMARVAALSAAVEAICRARLARLEAETRGAEP